MFHWREIGTLYRHEMRMALRERSIVVYSLLMPLFLYPLMFWLLFTGLSFVQGYTKGMNSRIALQGLPESHQALLKDLDAIKHFERVQPSPGLSTALEEIREGRLDLLVECLPKPSPALPDNFQVHLSFEGSKERSVMAKERFESVMGDYRARWLEREAFARGIKREAWTLFTLESRNVASNREITSLLLGMMLPLCFIAMLSIASCYPAIDVLAGERERNTWETLMSCGVKRSSVIVAKYLCVLSFGFMGGLLNSGALLLTVKPVLGNLLPGRLDLKLSVVVVPVLLLGAILLAAFIAALMLVLMAFARTFKEGQAMTSPLIMVALLPVILVAAPEVKFTMLLALVPIANIALMIRTSIMGGLSWPPVLITTGMSLILIWIGLRAARFILTFEDVAVGSFEGGFKAFFSRRLFRRRNTVPEVQK